MGKGAGTAQGGAEVNLFDRIGLFVMGGGIMAQVVAGAGIYWPAVGLFFVGGVVLYWADRLASAWYAWIGRRGVRRMEDADAAKPDYFVAGEADDWDRLK